MASNKETKRLIKRLRKDEPPDAVIAQLAAIGEPVIPKMLWLVAHRDAVKNRAERVLCSMGDSAVPALVQQLQSGDAHKRAAAAAALAQIGSPEAIQAIKDELQCHLTRSRNSVRRWIPVVAHVLLLVTVATVAAYMAHWLLHPSEPGKFHFPIYATGQVIAMSIATWSRLRKPRAEFRQLAAQEIIKLDDPRVVDLLAPLANDWSDDVRKTAQAGLIKLLPSTLPEHANEATLNSLRHLLTTTTYDVAFPVLDALSKTSDEHALRIIERIAGDTATYGAKFANAASEKLPTMRERVAAARTSAVLLRPAEPSNNEVLLRPTQNAETGSEVLLRPSN